MESTAWMIYLVENRLGQLYCGICTDLQRRFAEHVSGGPRCAKALRGKSPLQLVYATSVNNRSLALKYEYWLKRQDKKFKLSIIRGDNQLPIENEPLLKSELVAIQAAVNPKSEAD